jgi:hypothetical protein
MWHWIERIAATLARKPGQHPTVFCGLRAVSAAGLEADDGVRRMMVPWASVRRVSAEMGRQTYDMTPVLMIDHAAGRSIFLPETDELWAPFIAAMAVHLPSALPVEAWAQRLVTNPETIIRVYPRPGVSPR